MIDPHDIRKSQIEDAMINDAEDRAAQPLSTIAQLEQLVSNLRRDLNVAHQALAKANSERDELIYARTRPRCCWCDPRQCENPVTHYHHAYGTICGYHAKAIELNRPGEKEKCKLLKGPLHHKILGISSAGANIAAADAAVRLSNSISKSDGCCPKK